MAKNPTKPTMRKQRLDNRTRKDDVKPQVRKKGPVGPRLLTPELSEQLAKLITLGIPVRVACATEGISKSVFYYWRTLGAQGKEPYTSFFAAINQAVAKSEASITLNVIGATKHDWKAAAWWLEKRRPKRYGSQQTITLRKHPSQMTEAEIGAELVRLGHVEPND